MKTKTPRTKPLIIASTFALLGGLTRATVSVQNDLTNTVQTIQSVIFTDTPASYDANSKQIKLKTDSNNQEQIQVQIQGQVLATHKALADDEKNTLGVSATNSQLYYGQNNILEGSDSAILYGKRNKIYGSQNAVIGGGINIIGDNNRSSKNNFILGGVNNNINGQSSAIIGGNRNQIKGNKNLILAGEQKKVIGDQNYPFGSNIEIGLGEQKIDNTFVWSDSLRRRSDLIKFSPATSNTFLIRSANGVGVNTTNPVGQGVTVAGMVQLGATDIKCNENVIGAMRFLEETREGKTVKCFQACEKIGNEVIWRDISKTAECGYTPSAAGNQGENTPTPNQPTPQPQPQPINGQCGSEKNACVVGRLKEETDTSTHFKWKCLGENGGNDSPVCQKEKPINGVCGSEKNQCNVGSLKDAGETQTHFTWKCEGLYGGNDSPVCQKVKPQTPSQSCQIWLSGGNIRGDSIEIGEEGLDYHNDNAHYQIRKTIGGKTRLKLQNIWKKEYGIYSAHNGNLLLYRWQTEFPLPTLGLHIPEDWQGSYTIKLENLSDNDEVLCEKTYTVRKESTSNQGGEITPPLQNRCFRDDLPKGNCRHNGSLEVVDDVCCIDPVGNSQGYFAKCNAGSTYIQTYYVYIGEDPCINPHHDNDVSCGSISYQVREVTDSSYMPSNFFFPEARSCVFR